MLLIPCPHCGPRDESEFDYGGRALRLPDLEVASTTAIGLDPDFKEAIAFAAFAILALFGPPARTGSFTGAARAVRLGKLVLP